MSIKLRMHGVPYRQVVSCEPKVGPSLFENLHPLTGEKIPVVRNGDRWVTHRGRGIISGPYIQVIVDDSGALFAINELDAEL